MKLLVILFILKLYARRNFFILKLSLKSSKKVLGRELWVNSTILYEISRLDSFTTTCTYCGSRFLMRLYTWQYFIPFYFALDKTNCARCGSYYLESIKLTVIDQRGEQTINRDAKIAGGIRSYASNKNSF